MALCGLASSLDSLTLARFASGVTVAWILPISLAYIGDVVPYDQRQQVLGRFLAGQVLGQMFGQAAGGIVGDYFGWRTMFFAAGGDARPSPPSLSTTSSRPIRSRASIASAPKGRGPIASYKIVLRNPWARIMLLVVGLEGALFQGVFPYVGADLHLRFGLSFTAIGIIIGIFAIGGLVYAATVRPLMRRLGQTGIANAGGVLMGLSFLTLAIEPVWYFAPLATLGVGLGFFMLHNTLQTEGTQMTPEARGTSVALFASMYFLGQTVGVALAAPVMDRYRRAAAVCVRGGGAAGAGVLVHAALEAAQTLQLRAARDPFDLGLDDALDHARQVVVEPRLEQRPQHLPHQIFERAGVLHQHGLGQRVEGGIDRGRGVRRHQRAVEHGWAAAELLPPRLLDHARRRRLRLRRADR